MLVVGVVVREVVSGIGIEDDEVGPVIVSVPFVKVFCGCNACSVILIRG